MPSQRTTSAALCIAISFGIWASNISAQELPEVPADLINSTAVTCIKISMSGAVEDAFIVRSTGDQAKDVEVLNWVRQLHWEQAKPGEEKSRNTWIPMPVAFGNVSPPDMPSSCSPKQSPTRTS
jgi:TonB family protein